MTDAKPSTHAPAPAHGWTMAAKLGGAAAAIAGLFALRVASLAVIGV